MVKMPTQTMSSACQNRLKQISRWTISRRKPFDLDLRHHGREPQAADGDVQAVQADQAEEGGEEAAALRA